MSDWGNFCDSFEINPNEPDEFDRLLDSFLNEDEKILIHKETGVKYSFSELAEKSCARCNGAGYIGKYKWNCGGRCSNVFLIIFGISLITIYLKIEH